jgi:hypothetical protein
MPSAVVGAPRLAPPLEVPNCLGDSTRRTNACHMNVLCTPMVSGSLAYSSARCRRAGRRNGGISREQRRPDRRIGAVTLGLPQRGTCAQMLQFRAAAQLNGRWQRGMIVHGGPIRGQASCRNVRAPTDDARQLPCWNALSASAASGAVPRLVIGGLPAGGRERRAGLAAVRHRAGPTLAPEELAGHKLLALFESILCNGPAAWQAKRG